MLATHLVKNKNIQTKIEWFAHIYNIRSYKQKKESMRDLEIVNLGAFRARK